MVHLPQSYAGQTHFGEFEGCVATLENPLGRFLSRVLGGV